MRDAQSVQARGRRRVAKVPEKITVYFWMIKLLTTAMGEALSDFLVHHMNPYLAVVMGAAVFAMAILLQFRSRRYAAPTYWFAVAMVAVFGTMAADATHVVLGVPYLYSTVTFAIILAAVFFLWWAAEGTLSIHSIYTRRREMFYWAAVLSTFAMGTAAGDMTAATLHLGYLLSGLLFAALFAIPGVLYFRVRMNAVLAFWIAYVLTRPLGASFADWFGMPQIIGGLGYGHAPVAMILAAAIVILVAFVTVTRMDVKRPSIRLRGDSHGGP